MRIFYWLRVSWKLFLRRFRSINSFCKECGRDVHDFVVSDEIWNKVEPHIDRGYILCYDCFCEKCRRLRLPCVYKIAPLRHQKTFLTEWRGEDGKKYGGEVFGNDWDDAEANAKALGLGTVIGEKICEFDWPI